LQVIPKLLRLATALLSRPDLWSTALRTALRMAPNQWWRHGIVPPAEYRQYRANAVYGLPLFDVPPPEFIRYLEWCKDFPGPVH
jgi:hypothetical protein